jgi:hypothetical protein
MAGNLGSVDLSGIKYKRLDLCEHMTWTGSKDCILNFGGKPGKCSLVMCIWKMNLRDNIKTGVEGITYVMWMEDV